MTGLLDYEKIDKLIEDGLEIANNLGSLAAPREVTFDVHFEKDRKVIQITWQSAWMKGNVVEILCDPAICSEKYVRTEMYARILLELNRATSFEQNVLVPP